MSNQEVKVAVADDHALYRAGLRDLLRGENMQVVSEARSGQEAVELALKTHPDVVIMDVHMPGMDGIEASRVIKERLPETEIVMVTGFQQDQDELLRAIDAGARSYLGKDDAPSALVDAVRSASSGAAYLAPDAMRQLLRGIAENKKEGSPPRPQQKERLTPREREVLRLVVKGLRNQEIAGELGVSVRSIGNHLAKIYAKLHIHNRSEAILFALRNGIASLD